MEQKETISSTAGKDLKIDEMKKITDLFTLLMQIDQKIKRKDAKENDRHN